jgi:hypothetical protein|tara:strand:+ start:396 stop:665 length:270 start_codon:yes stop_codon:yes gene_type:complete
MFKGYSKQQTKVIDGIGDSHGLSKTKSRETFIKICQAISSQMADFESDENKIVNIDSMKTVNIPQFGKMIPKVLYVEHLNKARSESKEI